MAFGSNGLGLHGIDTLHPLYSRSKIPDPKGRYRDYSEQQVFDEWYKLEKDHIDNKIKNNEKLWWQLDIFPKCPKKICILKGEYFNKYG